MRKVSSLIYSILLIAGLTASVYAQKSVLTGNSAGASAFYGVLIPHNDNVQGLAANIKGLEFRYEWTGTTKAWQKDYRYPTTGIILQLQDNGNPELTGSSIGAGVFASFRIVQFLGTQLYFRPTAGVGFITKTFDKQENPSNRAIGSHFNIFAGLHGIWKIPITKHLKLNLTVGGSHYSNGNARMPNLGINNLQFMAGFDYIFQPVKSELPIRNKEFERVNKWEAMLVLAARQSDHVWVHNFLVSSIRGRRSYIVSPRSRLTGGIDVSFDKMYYYAENRNGSGLNVPLEERLEVGLTFGHHLLIGRTGIITEIGTYAYQPNDYKDNFFQRVGLRYDVKENQFAWLCIKSHYFSADYVEFGLGIGFGKKQKSKVKE